MITHVRAPLDVCAYLRLDRRNIKKLAVFSGSELDGLFQQRAQRTAEPVMSGNIEPDFLPLQDGGRKLAAHQVSQNDFLPGASDFQIGGKGGGKLHDAMIEKRWTDFNGVGHAGVVHLGEDVIGKKISLVEAEIGLQIFAGAGKFLQNGIERMG